MRLLSQKDYINMSTRIAYSAFGKKADQEQIGIIAHNLIRADLQYKNEDSGRDKYRYYYGLFGVKQARKRNNKKEGQMLRQSYEDTKFKTSASFNELLGAIYECIPKMEADIFIEYSLYGYSKSALCREYGLSKHQLNHLLANTKTILRSRLHV